MINKKQKKGEGAPISTASMPDIIFMLLIFFMVSTVMRNEKGIAVRLPSTDNAQKIEGRRNIANCYVDMAGRIMVDDKLMTKEDLASIMYLKRTQNPRVVVSLRIDEMTKNEIVDDVHKALQEADALRIVYASTNK